MWSFIEMDTYICVIFEMGSWEMWGPDNLMRNYKQSMSCKYLCTSNLNGTLGDN